MSSHLCGERATVHTHMTFFFFFVFFFASKISNSIGLSTLNQLSVLIRRLVFVALICPYLLIWRHVSNRLSSCFTPTPWVPPNLSQRPRVFQGGKHVVSKIFVTRPKEKPLMKNKDLKVIVNNYYYNCCLHHITSLAH